MQCSKCGADKVPYEFFRYLNKFDRSFFAAGIPAKSDVCYDCAGPYKCIKCGMVQPSTEYRIQGRICYTCQGAPKMARRVATDASNSGFQREQVTEVINADLDADMGVLE